MVFPPLMNQRIFSIEMINPNYIPYFENVARIIIRWSEWGDSNSRHLAPKRVLQRFQPLLSADVQTCRAL